MAIDATAYLADIELALIVSPIVASYQVVRSWNNTDDGYIRVRTTLTNGDFVESAEYFVIEQGRVRGLSAPMDGRIPNHPSAALGLYTASPRD